jgi:hypothetical protein
MYMQPIGEGSPLGLPYYRPGDPNSHDFVDLKAEPHRISELPELREEPELHEIVRQLNDKNSVFKDAALNTIQRFCLHSQAKPPLAQTYARFEIRPTRWHDERRTGWSLDFWTWGFGEDRTTAREAWVSGIRRFGEFLIIENDTWKAYLTLHSSPPSISESDGSPTV